MSKRRRRPIRTIGRLGLVSMVILAVAGLASPAGATGSINRYTMTVSGAATAGAPASFSVVFKNKGLGILDQLQLPVPAAFEVTAATKSKGTLSRTGNLIKLTKIALLPTKTVTLTISARVACGASTPVPWSATNVKGILGIPYTIDAAGSSVNTPIAGACSLKFLAQPTDAAPDETIDDGAGGPVTVGLFDGANAAITGGASVPVTVGIGTNPGGGTLSGTVSNGNGTVTQGTSAGVASFGDLSIDQPGVDYTLTATAPSFAGATSTPFTIEGLAVQCTDGTECSGTLTDPEDPTTSAILSSPEGGAGTLTASFTNDPLSCGDYDPFLDRTLEFNVTAADRGMEVTISFSLDGIDDYYFDLDDVEVCLQSELPFEDQEGETVEPGDAGLLPDCQPDCYGPSYSGYHHHYEHDPVPPCVVDRYFDGEGNVVIVFLTAPGDPKGRV